MANDQKPVRRRTRQKLNTTPPSERILWPALGFPEVIEVFRPIVLLLVSDKRNLTPQTVLSP